MNINTLNTSTGNSIQDRKGPEMSESDRPDIPNETATDFELFARFQEGDVNAFLELFDRHVHKIGQYCYRILGKREPAKDIVQDIWEKLLDYRDNTETIVRNPVGLLFRIARNLSLNYVRDQRPYTPLHVLSDEEHPKAENRSLSQLEELAILALNRLPLPQREILILHTYSEYTFEEIAQILEESPGSVRTKAWRARRQMKRILASLIELDENYKNI